VGRPADTVAVDPYGTASPEFVVGADFVRMWTSALAACHKRFEGRRDVYRKEPSGGLGAFTPDSFPVFDAVRDNAYVIADSNHGYKMIGVGALVARELLGEPQELLEPFRLSRYERGELHPTSHSTLPLELRGEPVDPASSRADADVGRLLVSCEDRPGIVVPTRT
jgi:glycine/D-amino acid oxidase-like deaminating enzyme